MKKLALSMFTVLFMATAFAQQQKVEELIKFTAVKHDFGKIKQKVPVTYDFVFKNIGKKAVVIESASASCGCTTPVKPEGAIAKGKSNKITAGFNAAAPGPFEKSIFVKVAGIDLPYEIKISGEVLDDQAYAKYESDKKSKKGGK